MDPDRRGCERLSILGELRGEVVVCQPIAIKDVSAVGLTIETFYPLHPDSQHALRLPLGAASVAVQGRVVHSEVSDIGGDVVTYRTGLEFVNPSAQATAAVAEFLAGLKAQRLGALKAISR